jgi:hypothetical protein
MINRMKWNGIAFKNLRKQCIAEMPKKGDIEMNNCRRNSAIAVSIQAMQSPSSGDKPEEGRERGEKRKGLYSPIPKPFPAPIPVPIDMDMFALRAAKSTPKIEEVFSILCRNSERLKETEKSPGSIPVKSNPANSGLVLSTASSRTCLMTWSNSLESEESVAFTIILCRIFEYSMLATFDVLTTFKIFPFVHFY